MNRKWFLGPVCIFILCGLLGFGLWPFRPPRNDVSWLERENGLRFGGYGTILCTDSFEIPAQKEEVSSSLEIWMKPGLTTDSNTILAFSTKENPLQFSVHQYRSGMVIKERILGARDSAIINIEHIFRAGRPVFIAITSDPKSTTVYIDGIAAGIFPEFHLAKYFTGRLVIGTSPVRTDGWLGTLQGLAVYGQELSPEQVRNDFESWGSHGEPGLESRSAATALYLFNEHSGDVVHNAVRPGHELRIPRYFSLLYQPFLKPFWSEFSLVGDYLLDTLVNIAGFVPLGFFLYAYWTIAKPVKSAALATVVLGLALSLTIEVLQSYLPTRHSGTTDLLTNTLGTYIGIVVCRIRSCQSLLGRLVSSGHARKGLA